MFRKHRSSKILVSLFLTFLLFFSVSLPAFGACSSTVAPGDTLWKIAFRSQVPINEIIKSNPQILNFNRIYPGQIIQIPCKTDRNQPTTPPVNETPTSNPPATTQPTKPQPPTTGISAFEQQVIDLTNAERTKAGLAPLKYNAELSQVARLKSEDMRDKNYFSHTSPTYGSPFAMLQQFGISFTAAGENIAAGYATPQEVVNGWMNSPGHRQNILNPNYTQLGVGYAAGGSYRHYWTQLFIKN
ncbi:MAG: LysM peptidoglycan-binding domain-containing protein [Syntrophomonadaceae bacterium]|nr:LysM peptidoglycan-binding domain-containing protein [Syntrophomonadaceae bacterium]